MNPLQKQPNQRTPAENEAEIERMMREQGIEPFNFEEGFGEGAELWTDEEFEEFQIWLRDFRRSSTPNRSKVDG